MKDCFDAYFATPNFVPLRFAYASKGVGSDATILKDNSDKFVSF